MLTNKNWVMTALTVDPEYPVYGSNLYNQFKACEKDNITKLSADGKATFDEGDTKCLASAPQTTTGSWSFNTTETILSITDSKSATQSYTIKSLTSSKMVATYVEELGGINYTYELTIEVK
ncbi:MAG TPA: lipocalin family protein [Catalimonadaceae bacterium]|nr:lipocalin family protein [Catalimonadaceae bacterium]HPI10805.1 lipocalin family protein [Catalimonadaceae bacterium]